MHKVYYALNYVGVKYLLELDPKGVKLIVFVL